MNFLSPKIRQTIYGLGTLATGVVSLLLLWNGIKAGDAENISNLIQAAIAMLGAGAGAVATSTVSSQRKDGTLDTLAPADQAINGIQATIQAVTEATSELERVKDAASAVAATVPGLGPLAKQIIDSIKL